MDKTIINYLLAYPLIEEEDLLRFIYEMCFPIKIKKDDEENKSFDRNYEVIDDDLVKVFFNGSCYDQEIVELSLPKFEKGEEKFLDLKNQLIEVIREKLIEFDGKKVDNLYFKIVESNYQEPSHSNIYKNYYSKNYAIVEKEKYGFLYKTKIRKTYLKNKIIQSDEIIEKIINNPLFISSEIIGIYYPMPNEIDLLPLMKHKKCAFPKVEKGKINFYLVDSLDDFTKSKFGVNEPNKGILIDKNTIDLIFVPGMFFSKTLKRIGHGKAYYDSYLIDYKKIKIGITGKEYLLNDFVNTKNDIFMDYLIVV